MPKLQLETLGQTSGTGWHRYGALRTQHRRNVCELLRNGVGLELWEKQRVGQSVHATNFHNKILSPEMNPKTARWNPDES